jgi:uncharacterized protein (TIGR03435 family)
MIRMWMKRLVRLPSMRGNVLLFVSGVLIAATQASHGQAAALPVEPASKADDSVMKSPEFEVASIKPFKQSGDGVSMMTRYTPDGFTGEGLSLHFLIRMAYGLEDNQVVGGEKWVDSDQYEVHAKMDEATIEAMKNATREQKTQILQKTMQALLADRFKLKTHRETRQLPVYELVLAKGGSKLQEAKEGDTYANGIKGPDGKSSAGTMRMGPGELTGQALPIKSLVGLLSDRTGRHVIDKTGLTGKYDFTLKWQEGDGPASDEPANGADAAGPSLFTALQEQLGLKLEAQKAPVEVLVVDHAEKPTAD